MSTFFLALAHQPWEEVCSQYLQKDIRSPSFWEEAIVLATEPLRRLEASPRLLAYFQNQL